MRTVAEILHAPIVGHFMKIMTEIVDGNSSVVHTACNSDFMNQGPYYQKIQVEKLLSQIKVFKLN